MAVKIRPARKRSKNPHNWEYDIRFRWPDGGEYRERAHAPVASKSGAQRWAEAREAALLAGGKAALEAKPVRQVETLTEFWPRFVRDHYRANRMKPSTIDAAEAIYKQHLAEPLGAKRLDAISNADVAGLKGMLAKKSPKTVNNILSVLSRALRAAVEWGLIPAVPCRIALLPSRSPTMFWYERHDYRRLVEGARKVGTGHLVLVLLGGSAGLRRGEIQALKWTDLDLERRQINVQRAYWRRHEEAPKGGRSRIVPMTPELAEALKAHRHLRGERVLYSEQGREMSNRSIRNWIATAQRRAQMEVTGAVHVLRHTFCSHLAAAGVPAKAIQELAGHADLATTQKYMHLAPSDRDGAMGMLTGYYDANPLTAVQTVRKVQA
jgi:integrase